MFFRAGRIDEYGDTRCCWHQVAQKFEALCAQFSGVKINSRHVTARPSEVRDKPKLYWIHGDGEDDGDCRGRRLGRKGRFLTDRGYDRDLFAYQIGRESRQSIGMTLGPVYSIATFWPSTYPCPLDPRGTWRSIPPNLIRSGCRSWRQEPDHSAWPAAARAPRAATRQPHHQARI